MDCRETAELLPWYLNRTLGPAERAAIEAHLETCAACRRELAETRFAARVYDAHLPAAAILDLAFGAPEPRIDRTAAGAHLADCEDCRAQLAAARESAAALAGAPAGAPAEPPAVSRPGKAPAGARVLPFGRVPAAVSPTWRIAALAATVAAIVSFGGWWVAYQAARPAAVAGPEAAGVPVPAAGERRGAGAAPGGGPGESAGPPAAGEGAGLVAEPERVAALRRDLVAARDAAAALAERLAYLERPQANPPFASLDPAGLVARGGPAGAARVEVPAGAAAVVLGLVPPPDLAFGATYTLVLEDASGAERWRAEGVSPQPPLGDFGLTLPAAWLEAPELPLRVRLVAADGSEVASYEVILARAATAP